MAYEHSAPLSRAALLLVVLTALNSCAWASKEAVLWNFIPDPNGANSTASLISDPAGNLYGTTQAGGLHGWGSVFELSPRSGGGWDEAILYSFSGQSDGGNPQAGLVMDGAGNLYGTAEIGGSFQGQCSHGGCGVVFELIPASDGTWQRKVLHSFQGPDGLYPASQLVLDSAGNLFGTTPYGGSCGDPGCGTVFELSSTTDGKWNFQTIYAFGENGNPQPNLLFDSAGNLYGTTIGFLSGQYFGTVFELSPGTKGQWSEDVLYVFCSQTHCSDGAGPTGNLAFDQAGNLYGATLEGGTQNEGGRGVVFELVRGSGGSWSEKVLYAFHGGKDGAGPRGGVLFDATGNLYGTTIFGGTNCLAHYGCGTVFELTPSSSGWTETIIHDFSAGDDGRTPWAGLMKDGEGNLYGTTVVSGTAPDFGGGGTMFELTQTSNGWQETVHEFRNTDGALPAAGLVSDNSGNLYGTTDVGGTNGYGTVFELSPLAGEGWRRTILYNFKGVSDGRYPRSPLTFDSFGNLYGTTYEGGSGRLGVVFELTRGANGLWTESVIHAFQELDGMVPVGGVVFDSAGNLYGATWEGGPSCCGVVFELTPSKDGTWAETILHNFTGGSDGRDPMSGVTLDAAGNVYGTTLVGGLGYGVVFELSPGSGGNWTENILYSFTGGSDGAGPQTGVVFDSKGNLYGTTYSGGSGCGIGCGVVFQLSPSNGGQWRETVIDTSDRNPLGGLLIDPAGNLYGTSTDETLNACPESCGTIFELQPRSGGGWKRKVIHTFTGHRDGGVPLGTLLLDTAGNIFGTASAGGPAHVGLVFEFPAGESSNKNPGKLREKAPTIARQEARSLGTSSR